MITPIRTTIASMDDVGTSAARIALGLGSLRANDLFIPGIGRMPRGVQIVSPKGYTYSLEGGDPGKSNGRGGTTNVTSLTSRIAWGVAVPHCGPQFVFGNFYYSNNPGYTCLPGANSYTIDNCFFEDDAGTITRCTFAGANSIAITPGSFVVSDPRYDLNLVAGKKYFLRTHLTLATAGQFWPGVGPCSDAFVADGVTYGSDGSASGSLAIQGYTGYDPLFPWCVIGQVATTGTKPVIGIAGDSIAAGVADSGTTLPAYFGNTARSSIMMGWLLVSLGHTSNAHGPYPLFRTTQPSAYMSQYSQPANFPGTLPFATACDYWIQQGGVNDITGNATLASIQGYLSTIWAFLGRSGSRVIQTKITPNSSWNATQLGTRNALNTWIDTQIATTANPGLPLYATIDPNPAIETATASGTWISGMSGDGLHPNGVGVNAIAQLLAPKLAALLQPVGYL